MHTPLWLQGSLGLKFNPQIQAFHIYKDVPTAYLTYLQESPHSICPYVFSCKMFVKSDFLFTFWNIIVMRKKGIAFFSNSLNL